jgi:hypothetical protein
MSMKKETPADSLRCDVMDIILLADHVFKGISIVCGLMSGHPVASFHLRKQPVEEIGVD